MATATRVGLRPEELASLLAAAEPRAVRAALAEFLRERAELTAALRRLVAAGHTSLRDPVVRAALRDFLASLRDADGAYRLAWVAALYWLLLDAMRVGAREIARDAGLPVLPDAVLRRVAARRAAAMARHVGATTARRIATATRDTLAVGGDAEQLASAIRDGVYGNARIAARATRIAEWELAGAIADGAHAVAVESGEFGRKCWVYTHRSAEPRDWHRRMHGETAPIGARFSNGLRYPREAGSPARERLNCKCECEYLP